MRLSGHETQQGWGTAPLRQEVQHHGPTTVPEPQPELLASPGSRALQCPAGCWQPVPGLAPCPAPRSSAAPPAAPGECSQGPPWSLGMVSPRNRGSAPSSHSPPPLHRPGPAAAWLGKPLQGRAAGAHCSPPAFSHPQCHPQPTSPDSRTPAGPGSAAAASHVAKGQPCCSRRPHAHSNNCKRQIIAVV